MAENVVAVEGQVQINGQIETVASTPTGMKIYTFGTLDTPGVAAANVYLSLLNPVGSGRVVFLFSSTISSYSVAATTAYNSMDGVRITAASGGTLQSASDINFLDTASGDPVMEVRTNNPTITAGARVISFPPPIAQGAGGNNASIAGSQGSSGAPIILRPGEGVAIRTASGDIDQRWNFQFAWGEL